MTSNTKRVFYVKYLAHPVYEDILRRREDVRLDRIDDGVDDRDAARILAAAHVYQIGSARDEIPRRYHVDATLLQRMDDLLVVSTSGAGYDTVDVAACTAAGVLVVNQAGGNREAVAEHVLGMMLALSKRIGEATVAMRRRRPSDRTALMGHDVFGKTIGIIGLGHVGSRVAELAGGLFAMKVLAFDPYLDAATCAGRGAEKVDLERLLRDSDYVSVNCPLTADTRGLIGAPQLALMREGAFFITTARGGIHDEQALEAALADGRLGGAGLDVWSTEPPPPDHPLLAFDNVLASPHTAGVTRETRANMGRIAAEQVLAALDGRAVARKVNPEVWPRYAERFTAKFGFKPRE